MRASPYGDRAGGSVIPVRTGIRRPSGVCGAEQKLFGEPLELLLAEAAFHNVGSEDLEIFLPTGEPDRESKAFPGGFLVSMAPMAAPSW